MPKSQWIIDLEQAFAEARDADIEGVVEMIILGTQHDLGVPGKSLGIVKDPKERRQARKLVLEANQVLREVKAERGYIIPRVKAQVTGSPKPQIGDPNPTLQ